MTVLNSMACRFLGDIHSHFRLFDVLISVLCYFVTCPIVVDMRMVGTLSDHQKDLQRKARKFTNKRRTVQSYQTDDDHHAGTRSHNTQTEKISISLERERNPVNMLPVGFVLVFFHVMHDAILCLPIRSGKKTPENISVNGLVQRKWYSKPSLLSSSLARMIDEEWQKNSEHEASYHKNQTESMRFDDKGIVWVLSHMW